MAKLALVVIARNEERCIGRCLRSASRFVDEMIVLDTGSTDDTVKIAKELGAKVFNFTWTDDFSAARNAALDHSSARWNLVLDADEWISDTASRAALKTALSWHKPFLGSLPIASEFDLQGQVEVSISWIPRLLPRGVRYGGRIHEQPISTLGQRAVQLPICHDGYRDDGIDRKKGRNRDLLLRALVDKPDDAYLLYQLGIDYAIYLDFANAVASYRRALLLSRPSDSYRHDLVVRTIFSLKAARQFEEAIQFAEEEMKNWQHSPDFFFVLGDLLFEWANLNPASAVQELLPMVESSWLRCLEIGDQPTLSGAVLGRGSHLAAHNLAVLYTGLGNTEQAEYYMKLSGTRQVQ